MRAFLVLLRLFISRTISAGDFETLYLFMFKNDPGKRPEAIYQILDDLFGDVDAYCGDPTIRRPGDLDDEQLRAEAITALSALEEILSQTG